MLQHMLWLSASLSLLVPTPQSPTPSAPERFLINTIKADNAREHLRKLTAVPHIAGSPADFATAKYVQQVLDQAGFATQIEEFHVLLSEPRSVSLKVGGRSLDLREQPFSWQADTLTKNPCMQTFNGYSASGDVDAEVVYAYYGQPADFAWLKSKGIDVAGKICLIRYGKVFRGLKVREAERLGAKGVLLYSDPDDDGYRKGDVYPSGPYRNRTGVQRGSIMYISHLVGDPLTPGWPAVKNAKRLKRKDCDWLPKIPCIPISWGNALEILRGTQGQTVPTNWQGGCPTTYHTGPGPTKVQMHVQMDESVRPIWNVLGRLRTTKTSDKFVLVGNHRDAWVYGANDPNTGSAVSLESMRALGALVKQGWQPRIEIRYASWDAEEQGLIGSTEHAELHAQELQSKCLAYFNCDAAVSGTRFAGKSTPELVGVLAYAAARTTAHDGRGRILTRWARGGSRPPVGNLGSGSDYTAFLCHLGIPAFDIGSRGGHGTYHSIFDNFDNVSRHLDKGFKIHASVARMLAIATHHFADSAIPPLDLGGIGPYLSSCLATLQDLPPDMAKTLTEAIEEFRKKTKGLKATEDQMIAMHKVFLDPKGIAGRPWYRNLLVAPGRHLGYGATVMPGIAEALADFEAAGDEAEESALKHVEHEVQRMTRCIKQATSILSR